jgi:hypothetical protein
MDRDRLALHRALDRQGSLGEQAPQAQTSKDLRTQPESDGWDGCAGEIFGRRSWSALVDLTGAGRTTE